MEYDVPIPLPIKFDVDYDDAVGIDCDQTAGDVATFSVPFPCEVFEAGLTVKETCGGASTTPAVKFDKRPTAGSDTNRGDGDVASFALSTTEAGKVMYDIAGQGVALEPGNEVVVQLTVQATGSGAAGHFIPYLLVKYNPETRANLTNMVETA